MQKKMSVIILVLILSFMVVFFTSCNEIKNLGKQNPQKGEKEVVVIIADDEYIVKTDTNYLHELMLDLSNKGEIEYKYSEGPYGASILKVNSLETSLTWNPYISVYHTIDDIALKDLSGYMDSINIKGTIFYPSGVGIELVPIIDGEKYLLVEISY